MLLYRSREMLAAGGKVQGMGVGALGRQVGVALLPLWAPSSPVCVLLVAAGVAGLSHSLLAWCGRSRWPFILESFVQSGRFGVGTI